MRLAAAKETSTNAESRKWIRASDLDEVTFFCSGDSSSGAETLFDGAFTACTVYSHSHFTFYCFWSIPAVISDFLTPWLLFQTPAAWLPVAPWLVSPASCCPAPPCLFSVCPLLTQRYFVLCWTHSSFFPSRSFLVCMTNFCLPIFPLRFTRDCFRSASGFIETIKKMCWN